ncbi:uncharacterized protein K452DRAFT_89617 [Aplosporella prunicola CBS 121167]|uniref:Uncharacterized protein n=1 Tax=Aplosporella prunicola CBS 121167 TaxID=1176127 RepID=A0A6A6B376_9PEZI|nr:uncharacterized protein K452DRAFT_89617 [Aplosporella prunicola CBS 121167]KAF2138639.1 hypothetical protein K452DRAFT_89617 [Aplosporella prunicola CBS 121167]
MSAEGIVSIQRLIWAAVVGLFICRSRILYAGLSSRGLSYLGRSAIALRSLVCPLCLRRVVRGCFSSRVRSLAACLSRIVSRIISAGGMPASLLSAGVGVVRKTGSIALKAVLVVMLRRLTSALLKVDTSCLVLCENLVGPGY